MSQEKIEAIRTADAALNNVVLPSYTDLVNTLFIAQCALGRAGANADLNHPERVNWEIIRNIVAQCEPHTNQQSEAA